jgi:hypothetical protein
VFSNREAIFKYNFEIGLQKMRWTNLFTTNKCLKVHPIKEFLIKKNNPQVPRCSSILDHSAAFGGNRTVRSMVNIL